jgi:hypothetical protein
MHTIDCTASKTIEEEDCQCTREATAATCVLLKQSGTFADEGVVKRRPSVSDLGELRHAE